MLIVQNGQPTYPHDPFVVADYDMDHYSGNGGEIAGSEITEYEWNNITLNDDGLSWINAGGTTKLVLRSQRDIDGTDPTAYEYVVSNSPPLLYLTTGPAGRSFGTIIG